MTRRQTRVDSVLLLLVHGMSCASPTPATNQSGGPVTY